MSSTRHVIDDIPAYALGILQGEEERQVAEHLADCALCQAELRAYSSVVEQLPLSAPVSSPAPRLRESILREAARDPRVQTGSGRLTWQESFNRFLRGLSPAWSMASLVLVVVLGISNLLLLQKVQQTASPVETQTPAADFRIIDLTGTAETPDARGMLVVSPDGRYGTLVVDGLPTLSEDLQYQLWLVIGEQRDSGGVFSVGASGYGALKVSSPQPLADYQLFGITIEPAGGSPAPTGERVLGSDA